MDLNELTIGAAMLWLFMVALAGMLVGWGWALLAAGVGAWVGWEAAVASERSTQKRDAIRCPRCGSTVSERHAICPTCFATLKMNCPKCGAILKVGTRHCPDCRRRLP